MWLFFAYGDGSSIKPPPSEGLSRALQGFYDADGFITRTEPLLVLQPRAIKVMYNVNRPGVWPSGPDRRAIGIVGYLKGRSCMDNVLMMLHVSFMRGIDLSSAHPKLYGPLLRIYAHHVPQSSKA